MSRRDDDFRDAARATATDEAPMHRGVYDDWDEDAATEADYEAHSRGLDFGLLLLRLGALALLPHGVAKATDLDAFTSMVGSNLVGGQAPELFAWLIMLGMVGLPILIAVGLFARPAGFLCAAMMSAIFALAILPRFDYRLLDNVGALTGESALLFVALTLPLTFTGAGRWSLDSMRTAGRP